MKTFIAVLIVTATFSAANAATFEWVDKAGVIHFADDPEKVPVDYRSKAIRRESISEERVNTVPEEKGPAADAAPAQKPEIILYGNHDESWWRNRYTMLDREMAQLRDGLPAKKEELEKLHRRWVVTMYAGHRAAYYDKKAEIERDEARIAGLEMEKQNLKDEANRFGVPVPWRR